MFTIVTFFKKNMFLSAKICDDFFVTPLYFRKIDTFSLFGKSFIFLHLLLQFQIYAFFASTILTMMHL